MASQSRGPSSGVSQAGPDQDWTNPGNIVVKDDGNAASVTVGVLSSSDNLYASGFGFTIPAGASIDGIVVDLDQDGDADLIGAGVLTLTKTGSDFYHPNQTGAPPAGYDMEFGTATDLWGTTWTPAEVNDPAFGSQVNIFNDGAVADFIVDYVQITVYYTVSEPPTDKFGVTPQIRQEAQFRSFGPFGR